MFDKRDGQMRDVDADPSTAELLRRMDRGAAAAEGIEHDIAFVRRGAKNAFEKGEGLLGRIAEAFRRLRVNGRYIFPNALGAVAHCLIQISFNANSAIFRKMKAIFRVKFSHRVRRKAP